RLNARAASFISPGDTLNAPLNASTSSLVTRPSALAILALSAIMPSVKGTSLSGFSDDWRRFEVFSASPSPARSLAIGEPIVRLLVAADNRFQIDIAFGSLNSALVSQSDAYQTKMQ